MNEKKGFIFKFISLCCFCCFFTNCATNKSLSSGEIIESNSRAIGHLEEAVKQLDRTTSESRTRIENAIKYSYGLTDGIERLEYLFNEYEGEVGRLLNEIDSLRNEIETQIEADNDTVYSSSSSDIE